MPGESSARESAQLIRDNFSVIDGDGDGTLTSEELDRFAGNPRRDENARNAATDFLEHFDLVRDMATPSGMLGGVTYATEAYNRTFTDRLTGNRISKKDVDLVLADYSEAGNAAQLAKVREEQTQRAGSEVATGVVIAIAAGAATVALLETGPFAIAPAAVAAGGIGMVGKGVLDYFSGASELVQTGLDARKAKLQSW